MVDARLDRVAPRRSAWPGSPGRPSRARRTASSGSRSASPSVDPMTVIVPDVPPTCARRPRGRAGRRGAPAGTARHRWRSARATSAADCVVDAGESTATTTSTATATASAARPRRCARTDPDAVADEESDGAVATGDVVQVDLATVAASSTSSTPRVIAYICDGRVFRVGRVFPAPRPVETPDAGKPIGWRPAAA